MIPQFPEFKKIELSDREDVEAHTKKYPPYSDFNFTSLWAWDLNKERRISILHGNLVVRFTDYSTQELFFSFLGTNEVERTVLELLEYSKSVGIQPTLRLVPEIIINEIDTPRFKVVRDRGNFDYVYLISLLAKMSSKAYKSKRVPAERFLKEQSGAHFEIKNLSDPIVQKDITSVIRSWEKKKKSERKEYEIEHEEKAIKRLFKMSLSNDLMVGAVFIGEVMDAFTIEEVVPHKYSIGHFWKTSGIHTGVYDFLAQKTAQYLQDKGIVYWNWEQDLDKENLRFSKTSYRPSDFLKKYQVLLVEGH
jgi:hypothetical protein